MGMGDFLRLAGSVLLLLHGVGCGAKQLATPDDAGTVPATSDAAKMPLPAGSRCTQDAECGEFVPCLFQTSDGCGAAGHCASQTNLNGLCVLSPPVCGCDGRTIQDRGANHHGCYAAGTAPFAVRHEGACAPPAGSPCVRDADCGDRVRCLFSIAEGCAAKGKCDQEQILNGTCIQGPTVCGCDGKTQTLSCYDTGTASAPVLHEGGCSATSDAGVADARGD